MIRNALTALTVGMLWSILALGCTGHITGGNGDDVGGDDDIGDPGDRPLEIDPQAATLAPGTQRTFSASRSGTPVTDVDWSVEEGAAGGAITAAGDYTAPAAEGTYTVVATESSSGERARKCLRMRCAESWMGVRGFLISCASRRATSRQAATFCARRSWVRSSRTIRRPEGWASVPEMVVT